MGLRHAVPTKDTHEAESDELLCACVGMQGSRPEMEDAHCLRLNIQKDLKNLPNNLNFTSLNFFGVFDGHAGDDSSKYCAANILETVDEQLEKSSGDLSDETIIRAYLNLDEKLKRYMEKVQGINPINGSGTTGITCFVKFNSNTDVDVICPNVGDSRCVLYHAGKTYEMSRDQKPNNEIERKRIEAADCIVTMNRVAGNLAVARAFGDFRYKTNEKKSAEEQAVCCVPEITRQHIEIQKGNKTDPTFLILACDGLWDKFSNEEATAYVREQFKKYDIFNEDAEISEDLQQPIKITWINKKVDEWDANDVEGWIESLGSPYNNYFANRFRNGVDLRQSLASDEKFNRMKETLKHAANFVEEFKKKFIERNELQEQPKKVPKSTHDKLVHLTERMVDYAVFDKRSDDNVSVAIILFK
ncbi:hypothetical protein ABK040_007945 [Willaertia magna]